MNNPDVLAAQSSTIALEYYPPILDGHIGPDSVLRPEPIYELALSRAQHRANFVADLLDRERLGQKFDIVEIQLLAQLFLGIA